ncbi:MAG TPA: hypothetical protein VJZ69_01295 [Clostridia bacterium]|nr:hypothetical protein [Clostridia bacterium]
MKQSVDELVASVKEDFEKRREMRRPLELCWRLNMNFLMGNQFCSISHRGDIEEDGKQYFWQQREVYNHIAPIVETRLSKLARVKAKASVRPSTSDDIDVASAKFSTAVLETICAENNWNELLSRANMWSETCGTAFYKVVWDTEKGMVLDADKTVREGDVSILVIPPFEIFPENLAVADINAQNSIIHAKAYTADEVKRLWGKDVKGTSVSVFSLDNASVCGGLGYSATTPTVNSEQLENAIIVIEKYELPTSNYPNGRLIIVGGDELLYDGELPYINGENGLRCYPFCKQVCLDTIGEFFGTSVVERIIPVQRSYNTVKNRKHEFMNRIAMGVMAVEDGSVDTDNLEEEGLSPGKVLIYRQGSTPPIMLNAGQVPSDFHIEEDRLLSEFVMISGVSEVTTYSQVPSNVASGTAISLLLEQDDTRISLTADSLRSCVKEVGKQILRLYKQFATLPRIKRIAGENGDVEMRAFSATDLSNDDLVFDTANELEDTNAGRKTMLLELLKLGLLTDDNGGMTARSKTRIFDILGFGNWEDSRDIDELHMKKAQRENAALMSKAVIPDSVDNHLLHIDEHTKLLITKSVSENTAQKARVLAHINRHKELSSLNLQMSELEEKLNAVGQEKI